jgi:hypothetical protein
VGGVGKKAGTWGEAFGGGAEGGPPTGAGFLEEEELGAVMGAEEAGGDDLGVVEDEEVGGVEEAGEVGDVVVGEGLGFAAKEEKAGRVARVGGLGGDGGGGELVGQERGEGFGGCWGLTGGLA